MKKIVFLLGLCFSLTCVYAQRFEVKMYDDGNTYELRIKNFDKLFADFLVKERLAQLTDEDVKGRDLWRDSCVNKKY